MKDNVYEYFIWMLQQIAIENPNDADLGRKVREFLETLKANEKS